MRELNCWELLGIVGNCWELLGIVGNCWELLGIVGNCWELLGIVGNCWELLGIPGKCGSGGIPGGIPGQSCIIKRYCEKRFVSKYLATIGIDYGVTKVQIRDREIKVNIFDMAGHPFFYEVRNEFYKDTQGVLLVYDVGSKESFDSLDSWLAEMKQELGPHGSLDNVVCVVCANKVDAGKLRVVDESEGRLWAESRGFLYWETSAQSGEGIQEMFQTFYSAILELCENGGKRPPGSAGISFTREQADAIRRIRNSKDSWDMLGLKPGASREEVTRAYRRLAVLLHPDKCLAPGSEDAFKAVVNARTALLKNIK
ncbi:dnaJ homolog subfamily C member 27 isoform X2 [Chamaea fasciata]|uniref:dnaJ homolog subfamily C member 27 isoform X2 n=1 Tax=Chamaea fasciata TaxID=190680 RepID=UPI00336A5C30